MPGCGAGVKADQIACRPQGKAVAVPARCKILVDPLQAFVRKALEHPQNRIAPQAAEAADPHRDAAGGKALGQDRALRRNDLLTVEPGSRRVQQQVHGEGGLILLLGTAEHPAVVQKGSAPDPLRVQSAAAGDPGIGLLVDQNAVADLLGEPEHHTAVKRPVFDVVGAVAVGLQLSLLGQVLCLRCGGLFRAGHAGGKPEAAPEVRPGAERLLGLAQTLGRIEGTAKAAFNVGAVLGGILPQGDVGQPLVCRGAGAARFHGTGVLHGQPVGLDHLGGQRFGGKRGQQPLQMQMKPHFVPDPAVKQGKPCKQAQQLTLELAGLGRLGGRKCLSQPALVGGHHRRMPALYGAPAVSLHGVDQLIFCHPLLPRKLVLDAEEIVRVGPAQLGKDRAAGQFQQIDRAFEVEPCQIVQLALPEIAVPCGKKVAEQVVAIVFVHQPHDTVHIKIDRAVGVAGQEKRLKAVGSRRRPHLIGGPPLLGGITPGIHQRNSFSAVRLAGMRAAITSRISPCS